MTDQDNGHTPRAKAAVASLVAGVVGVAALACAFLLLHQGMIWPTWHTPEAVFYAALGAAAGCAAIYMGRSVIGRGKS